MKILVFTEGTIFSHASWIGLPREEIVRRVKAGDAPGYFGTVPIGNAVEKLRAWQRQGALISYLTSRRDPQEVEQVRRVLQQYDLPQGQLLFRLPGENYGDAAERSMPDILIEDDCESIGGEVEMTYPQIRPELKAGIRSIVVKEFGGIDHLPDDLSALAGQVS